MNITKSLRNFSFKKSVIINNQGSVLQDAQLLLNALKDIRYCIHMGVHMDTTNFFDQVYPLNPGASSFKDVNPSSIYLLMGDLHNKIDKTQRILDYSIPEDSMNIRSCTGKVQYTERIGFLDEKSPILSVSKDILSGKLETSRCYKTDVEVVMNVQLGIMCVINFSFPSEDKELI